MICSDLGKGRIGKYNIKLEYSIVGKKIIVKIIKIEYREISTQIILKADRQRNEA